MSRSFKVFLGVFAVLALAVAAIYFFAKEPPAIPSQSDQVLLVKRSVHDFTISVENKSMEHFYGTISLVWKKMNTVEELNENFKKAYDLGAQFRYIDSLEPIVEPVYALADQEGHLVLKGYYPTKPKQIHFEQTYVYEGNEWKIMGFAASAK